MIFKIIIVEVNYLQLYKSLRLNDNTKNST